MHLYSSSELEFSQMNISFVEMMQKCLSMMTLRQKNEDQDLYKSSLWLIKHFRQVICLSPMVLIKEWKGANRWNTKGNIKNVLAVHNYFCCFLNDVMVMFLRTIMRISAWKYIVTNMMRNCNHNFEINLTVCNNIYIYSHMSFKIKSLRNSQVILLIFICQMMLVYFSKQNSIE